MAANFTYLLRVTDMLERICFRYIFANGIFFSSKGGTFVFREDFFIFRREFILDYVCLDISNYFVDA